jgi:hypothetical protein
MLIHLFNLSAFKNDCLIDQLNGDVGYIAIRSNKRAPNILKIAINTCFARYNDIATKQDFGIRVQDVDQDMLFVFRDRTIDDDGVVTLEMPSYVYTLLTTPLNNISRVLTNYSLATFLNELDSTFVFTPIGADRDINIVTGANDNLELLTEAVTYGDFFDWVDAGLKLVGSDLKPNIVYGDFRDIESYYNTSSDARFTPIVYNTVSLVDNIYDDTQLHFEDVEVNTAKESAQYIFPYVNTGMDFTQATTIKLRKTNYSFVNPQFPIVKQTSSISGEDYYCIINPFAPANNKFKVYEYEYPANTQNTAGNFDTVPEITEEVLYKRAVAYIQSLKTNTTLTINPTYKKLVLAGTKAKVSYKRVIKGYDGQPLYTQDFSGDYILDNIDLDVNSFA